MNDREIFVDNLNYYLGLSGKLQCDLADYVGAKRTTVSGWTRGISYPRADAMEKIADFFNIPTSQLIGPRDANNVPIDLSQNELKLLAAYRDADPDYQRMALKILRDNPRKEKDTIKQEIS